jgi:hypothetical protein
MKICHLFVTVIDDGMGDFSHFVDIYTALKNEPDLNKIQFIPVVFVVGDDEDKIKKINDKLRSLDIPLYFCGNAWTFAEDSLNHRIMKTLEKSDQILFISAEKTLYNRYRKKIKPKTILKTINEHEGCISMRVPNSRKFSMGLAEGCYGIKISDFTPLSLSESSSIIAINDPIFWDDLLRNTGSRSDEEFNRNNTIVPAYFNCPWGYSKFLTFLVTQHTDRKDIAVYFSGRALNPKPYFPFEVSPPPILSNLADTCNVRVELIKNKDEKIVYNASASKVIRIFTEYNISDLSYRALYSKARIAGVSGDNILEYAISHNVFPFYMSTNFDYKEGTLLGLQKISQLSEVPISDEARRSFNIYFNPTNYLSRDLGALSSVNLSVMIDAWPHIAFYLRTKKNFYNQLKAVFLEGLPKETIVLEKPQETPLKLHSGSVRMWSFADSYDEKESDEMRFNVVPY